MTNATLRLGPLPALRLAQLFGIGETAGALVQVPPFRCTGLHRRAPALSRQAQGGLHE